MKDPRIRWFSMVGNSRTLRLFGIGFLALFLLLPVARIGNLVSERQARAAGAVSEVSSKWGKSQSVVGPALVLPYGDPVSGERSGNLVLLPRELHMRGDVSSETRNRGIFSVPVYRLDLRVEGNFGRIDTLEMGVTAESVHWERAHLVVAISDVRAIQGQTAVDWNGDTADFLPGTGGFTDFKAGIRAPVSAGPGSDGYRFSFPLVLNGSSELLVAPFAQTTVVDLRSNSTHPSFQGNWLPTKRTVSKDGFEAGWSISFLGRNYPQSWTDGTNLQPAIEASLFGLALVEPVDTYVMADRSLKYAALFIMLTFALLWLIEVLGATRVHPIQYLMLGAALCLFYLLELSLAEHLGFAAAYAIASLAIVGMVGAFSWVIFRHRSRTSTVTAAVAGLYGYLFILLRNQDYALLLGSVGLFVILGTIMYATRRIDWSAAAMAGVGTRGGGDVGARE